MNRVASDNGKGFYINQDSCFKKKDEEQQTYESEINNVTQLDTVIIKNALML